jgi:uncharacterized protein (TIGR02246 family)
MIRLFLVAISLASACRADIAADVEKTERAFVDAVVKGDASALEKYLAPDLVYTHSGGNRDTRESYIERIRAGKMKYERWDFESLEARKVTDDVAIVAGRAAVRVISGAKPVDMKVSLLHVFARRDGRWQLVAHQSARLP